MFWCVVWLYIFTRCLYFDEPIGLVKIQTTSKNIQRYYTPKYLIRYIYYRELGGMLPVSNPTGFAPLNYKETDIGVCGIAVLDNFSCGISVNSISKCGIAVFSEPAGCGFLAFWTVLKIILLVLQRFPSLFRFPVSLAVSDWTFPMKLVSRGNGKLKFLASQS